MSSTILIVAVVLVALDLLACMLIAFYTRKINHDAKDYFIGGKQTGTLLLLLTAWASFSGAGNFIGQAGRGALQGTSSYWLWLGEGFLGGIAMATLIAPYLARFSYVSMPHYIAGHLCGGNKYVRMVGGFAALMPNLVWPGAQIMGIAYVLEQVFGVDYRLGVVICGIVLISHTAAGGVKAVIFADALHGTIQMIFAVLVIYFGLKTFDFNIAVLESRVMAIDPSKWDLFKDPPTTILTGFFTGFVGATSNPIFWNRAFAAKDVSTARKSYGLTFLFNIIMVFLIILIGISAFTYNNNVGDEAMVWLILNHMPPFFGAILPVSVFAACMSCADTHLNCAAANIVSDIIDPDGKLPPEKAVKYAKVATVVAGLIAILCGLYADYIYALGTYGYTVCGGVLIPLFVVGLCMLDKKSETFKSKLDVRSAKIGITFGVLVAVAFEVIPSWYAIFGGGVIPAIVGTVCGLLIPNFYFKAVAKQ